MPSAGGQRDDELALGMLAIHLERAGKPDRDLGHTGEVLDVSLGDLRVERVAVQVLQLHPAELLHEPLPLGDDRGGVVVFLRQRDRPGPLLRVSHVVLHGEGQPADPFDLDGDLDLVSPFRQHLPGRAQLSHLAKWELLRTLRGDVGRGSPAAIAHVDLQFGGRKLERTDAHPDDPGEGHVTQAVLQAEVGPVGSVGERAEGVELPEEELRNLHGGGSEG